MKIPTAILLVSLAATVFLTVGCAASASPSTEVNSQTPTASPVEVKEITMNTEELMEEGQYLFESACASCHGEDARGLPNLGKDLVGGSFFKTISDEDLSEFIKKGRPSGDKENTTGMDMPPKGGNPALTDADITAIIAFLRSLQE